MNLNNFQLFDAHLHIVDPRFPLIANQGYLPAPFTIADYRARTAAYNLVGGAVVTRSFQAFDQSYLRAALTELGPGFVGVTQLSAEVSDAEIRDLHAAGVRAVRFNLKRGVSA
jgi:predicted TIM-barrel fold metal-dependent hydrolase